MGDPVVLPPTNRLQVEFWIGERLFTFHITPPQWTQFCDIYSFVYSINRKDQTKGTTYFFRRLKECLSRSTPQLRPQFRQIDDRIVVVFYFLDSSTSLRFVGSLKETKGKRTSYCLLAIEAPPFLSSSTLLPYRRFEIPSSSLGLIGVTSHAWKRFCTRWPHELPADCYDLESAYDYLTNDFRNSFKLGNQVNLPRNHHLVRLIKHRYEEAIYVYNSFMDARFVVVENRSKSEENRYLVATVERPIQP